MVSASPLSTRVSVQNMEVVDDVCRSAFGCGGIDLSMVAFVLLTFVLAVLVIAAIVHVREASSVVEEERRRLAAERDAFEAFSRRLAGMDVADVPTAVPVSGGIAAAPGASTGPGEGLDDIEAAYRDTVMSVDHYDDDYGEPLDVNLAAEFGDGIAYAVVDGRQLTPQLKAALLEASQEATRNRSAFLSTLEAEAAALAETASELEEIADERGSIAAAPFTSRSFEELVAAWTRLGELADRCRTIARERQERIRSSSSPPDGPDLYEYLYEELSVTHPVLADVASLSETVNSLRSKALQSITRRV